MRYDDWNGVSAHERFDALASIDKYADLTSRKMSEFGKVMSAVRRPMDMHT